eukprot:7664897-Alexandrium_andersonii.AAC.1
MSLQTAVSPMAATRHNPGDGKASRNGRCGPQVGDELDWTSPVAEGLCLMSDLKARPQKA